MSEHRGAGGAAGPVVARRIFASRERAAVRLGAGENVVHVRFVAARVDHLTFFAERGFLADLVVIAVEIVDVFCNDHPLAFFHGPLPIRSRALTAGLPSAPVVPRYA